MAISLYPGDWPFAIFKVLTGEHPPDGVEIIRILHDRMDIEAHLDDD